MGQPLSASYSGGASPCDSGRDGGTAAALEFDGLCGAGAYATRLEGVPEDEGGGGDCVTPVAPPRVEVNWAELDLCCIPGVVSVEYPCRWLRSCRTTGSSEDVRRRRRKIRKIAPARTATPTIAPTTAPAIVPADVEWLGGGAPVEEVEEVVAAVGFEEGDELVVLASACALLIPTTVK